MKARIGNATGPYEDLLTSVKRHKLNKYGHVILPSGLAKTILQETVQGVRRRGTQRKRWEDNIKEWTGLEWNIILRKAENREEWKKLVVKSTVVPQWSAKLGDRWDEMISLEKLSIVFVHTDEFLFLDSLKTFFVYQYCVTSVEVYHAKHYQMLS